MGLILFLVLLFICSSGAEAEDHRINNPRLLHLRQQQNSTQILTQIDVANPTTTIPVYYPGNHPAAATVPTYTTPTTNNPLAAPANNPTTGGAGTSGQSWCIATPSASQTALQVALDYACGYGGADCSAIQPGGSCYNPDTVRDHASYAFNSYYQKNPMPTSCDFGGTAMVTSTDPSTPGCTYPSASTSSSTTNPTNPGGSSSPPVFGSTPPSFGSSPPIFGSGPPAFGSGPPAFGSGPPLFGSSPPDLGGTTTSMAMRIQILTASSLFLVSLSALRICR